LGWTDAKTFEIFTLQNHREITAESKKREYFRQVIGLVFKTKKRFFSHPRPSGARRRRGFSPELLHATWSRPNQWDSSFPDLRRRKSTYTNQNWNYFAVVPQGGGKKKN